MIVDLNDSIQAVLSTLAGKISRDKKGMCMGCMKETPAVDLGAMSVYVPNDPAVTGKIRIVGYVVCLSCLSGDMEKLAQRVEGNIIRDGIMLETRGFGPDIKP